MEVFTPHEVAKSTGSKYRGILVAAKFARYLNEFPSSSVDTWEHTEGSRKLTTLALKKLTSGELTFRELRRRRTEA
jgi:DNA-directed RNA polymerase subunit K/omega